MAGAGFLTGAQTYLPSTFRKKQNFELKDLKDYDVVVQRLKQVPRFVSNVIEVLKEGVRKNMTLSAPSLTRSEAQFAKLLAQAPEETSFFELFKNINETSYCRKWLDRRIATHLWNGESRGLKMNDS